MAHLREIAAQPEALQPMLNNLLQMTNVAAAASVINGGVSAVGFAVMAHKLNRLQSDMNRVLSKLDCNQRELLGELKEIKQSLVELHFIGLENQALLREALEEVRLIRKDLLDAYLARVLTEIEVLREGRARSSTSNGKRCPPRPRRPRSPLSPLRRPHEPLRDRHLRDRAPVEYRSRIAVLPPAGCTWAHPGER